MNKFHSLMLTILCAATFVSQATTYEEQLQYELLQRKTTQKMIVNMRNISGVTTILGICALRYMGTRWSKFMQEHLKHSQDSLSINLSNVMKPINDIPLQRNRPELIRLPFYFEFPMGLAAIGFIPSLITFVTTTCYGFYNDMHIKALQQELAKIEEQSTSV